MKKVALLCILLIAMQVGLAVIAANGSARNYLDHFVADLQQVSATFTQSTRDANGHEGETLSGKLALKQPDLFRWDVQAPYEQLIIADGKKIWVYDPELDQVTVQSQLASQSRSPLAILTDLERLDREYETSEKGTNDGLAWLRLTPKWDQSPFAYVDLGLDVNGLEVMVFRDQVGNTTETRFNKWQRNAKLPAKTFTFDVPQGVDVIETETGDNVPEVMPLQMD